MRALFEAIALAAWAKLVGASDKTRIELVPMGRTAYGDTVIIPEKLEWWSSVPNALAPAGARTETLVLRAITGTIWADYSTNLDTLVIGLVR